MSWNNAYERKKFNARIKREIAEYQAAGMTEEHRHLTHEFGAVAVHQKCVRAGRSTGGIRENADLHSHENGGG